MKNVAAVRGVEAAEVTGLPDEVQVALSDIAQVAREALSVSAGLAVMAERMQAEITAVVGPKHAKLPDRSAVRHTPTPTSVVLGGRKVPMSRPRARTTDRREVQLASYATFASEDPLNQIVLERMLAGVATRRHRAAAEPVGEQVEQESRSTSKSAISRRFVQATAEQVAQLMAAAWPSWTWRC